MEEGPRSGRGGLVTRCVCALCCSRAHEKSRAVRFARQSLILHTRTRARDTRNSHWLSGESHRAALFVCTAAAQSAHAPRH